MSDETFFEKGRMMSAILELSLRVGSGGQMTRVKMIPFCREVYGTEGKTHVTVLREMLAKWEATYGERFELERAYENAGLTTEGAE